jgi:hypothetical protein
MAFDFTNPYGMVTGQPNLGSITPQPQPTQTPNPMGGGKNDKLSLMLFALGGALKGDKNFVQNTMQLQQMQEGKRRKKEMEENWNKALGKLEGSVDPTLIELAKIVGAEKGTGLIASGLPKTTKGPTSYQEYLLTLPLGEKPTGAGFDAFLLDKEKSGATQINLDQKRDTIFAQEAAKAGFATKKEVDKQIELDKQLLSRVQMSKRLLQDGIKTGKVEEILMPLRELAIGLGVADEATISKFGQQELFQSLTNYLVPRMRVEGSGSTSDMEIDLFRSAVPNMGRTAEGNLVIAAGIENLVAYNIKRQRLMDAYLKENKNLLGFGEYADQQLGSLYKSYNSDNEFDRLVEDGVFKEGDFVYDGINGQFRVLKQEDVL